MYIHPSILFFIILITTPFSKKLKTYFFYLFICIFSAEVVKLLLLDSTLSEKFVFWLFRCIFLAKVFSAKVFSAKSLKYGFLYHFVGAIVVFCPCRCIFSSKVIYIFVLDQILGAKLSSFEILVLAIQMRIQCESRQSIGGRPILDCGEWPGRMSQCEPRRALDWSALHRLTSSRFKFYYV